mgnify:FL=1
MNRFYFCGLINILFILSLNKYNEKLHSAFGPYYN